MPLLLLTFLEFHVGNFEELEALGRVSHFKNQRLLRRKTGDFAMQRHGPCRELKSRKFMTT